jgi:hypothetical protein
LCMMCYKKVFFNSNTILLIGNHVKIIRSIHGENDMWFA